VSVDFPRIKLKGQLRPSQREVIEIARRKLAEGKRQLHIVAPPGSGKTILGLYLWAECVRCPALVLSPNSAIQSQWEAKIELFEAPLTKDQLVSTDPKQPRLLTSLTYQTVTLPRRGDQSLDEQAFELWVDSLINKGQAHSVEEARLWIDDLRERNRNYHEQRLGAYRKQVRDSAARNGLALEMLHDSSVATWERLRDQGLGMVIFDECHHLMEHWGRVLASAHEWLGKPVIVGLTATPPDRDGQHPEDARRYDDFFGEVDFEVPVPAVVKDGFLAPYQDLVYFVRPAAEELRYIAQADAELNQIVDELSAARGAPKDAALPSPSDSERDNGESQPPSYPGGMSLPEWLRRVLVERRLPTGTVKDWGALERRDPEFAEAARLMLLQVDGKLPDQVPMPLLTCPLEQIPRLRILVPVLDRYLRHYLRRSPDGDDHLLAEKAIQRLRRLGVQITETGCQACASPVGRVIAYSRNKLSALLPVLQAERLALGDAIRAVVVADFEKSSASADVADILDAEAGGAVAAFKALLAHHDTDALNPILVTGTSVLVDDDLAEAFESAARAWLKNSAADAELEFGLAEGFHIIRGSGPDWCPRVYVAMITNLFQQGLTRCLVGTRGLLGEGWDANKINVLIDLTTVTTSMTVNQLRGRSIRLDPDQPEKLADNWDVVCLAPEFTKGLDDYRRFLAKHQQLYGVTDDGAVEKGAGHVHPAFTELRPEGVEDNVDTLNAEMLGRVARRSEVRQRWRVGQPYRGQPRRTVELRGLGRKERAGRGFPPYASSREPWSNRSLAQAVGKAVADALREAGLIKSTPSIHLTERAGGYVRLFLEQAENDENELFTESLQELFAPLDQQPRYLIPRDVMRVQPTWLGDKLGGALPGWLRQRLPTGIGRMLESRKRERAMWHAVPAALAKNKDLVEIFQRHWNRHVSPGQAIYGLREDGDRILADARRNRLSPEGTVHPKEIFE